MRLFAQMIRCFWFPMKHKLLNMIIRFDKNTWCSSRSNAAASKVKHILKLFFIFTQIVITDIIICSEKIKFSKQMHFISGFRIFKPHSIFKLSCISFCLLNELKWNETEQLIETFKGWLNTDLGQISFLCNNYSFTLKWGKHVLHQQQEPNHINCPPFCACLMKTTEPPQGR